MSMSTDTIEPFFSFIAKHCTRLPDDGSSFKYFIILIVSTNFILCISWIIKCLTVVVHSENAHTIGSHIVYNCIDIKVHV
jgi:hypothetical protein